MIRKWAEPPRRKIGPFTTDKMEETYIRDLTIRLGYPYVYVHQVKEEYYKIFKDQKSLQNGMIKAHISYMFTFSINFRDVTSTYFPSPTHVYFRWMIPKKLPIIHLKGVWERNIQDFV